MDAGATQVGNFSEQVWGDSGERHHKGRFVHGEHRSPGGVGVFACPHNSQLAEAGRRAEGLTAIQDAVAVYRRLAEANPAFPPATPDPRPAGSSDDAHLKVLRPAH